MSQRIWADRRDKESDEDKQLSGAELSPEEITERFSLPAWVAKLLSQRAGRYALSGMEDVERFLQPSLKHLPDPLLLQDMEWAAERVAQAIMSEESIMVFGDYDVDGTVGAAILRIFFRRFGLEPMIYQPDRKKEGYGLNSGAVRLAAERGVSLMIAVDCGITSIEEAKVAKELGVDLIICDHHEPKEELPEAFAVLDHKRHDDESGIDNLCGAGMAFYLALAVRRTLREQEFFTETGKKEPDLRELLDLVAIATIADMVPLIKENRVLAKVGLQKLRQQPSLGVKLLCEVSGVEPKDVQTYHVGFLIGPRINASGRLGSANLAMELLSATNEEDARAIAKEIDGINKERMEIQNQIAEAAAKEGESILNEKGMDFPALVIGKEGWHEGVIGIVASRMVELFHRPAIVCAFPEADSEPGKGSVRSMGPIDVLACLEKCADLLIGFGGHKAAAGITIAKESYEAFQDRFAEVVGAEVEALTKPGQKLLDRTLFVDLDISGRDLDFSDIHALEQLGPFGIGNPEPVFTVKGYTVNWKRVLKEKHLKLSVGSQGTNAYEALWFSAKHGFELNEGENVDIAFSPKISEFRGRRTIEFRVKDLHI